MADGTTDPNNIPTNDIVAYQAAMNKDEAESFDWAQLSDQAVVYGENVISALLIIIGGAVVIGWVGRLLNSALSKRESLDPSIRNLAVRLTRGILWIIVLTAVLGRFGIETASIIAVLGTLGLAVGLALQGTLSNVASGVMMMMLKPFKAGDVIKVGADVYVTDNIGLFVTSAHLPDGPYVTLPNNKLWGSEIINLSNFHDDVRRMDLIVGIAYQDDIERAMTVAQGVLDADERYLKDPAPLIAVESLGDSSVNILVRVYTKPSDWWQSKLDLTKAVKLAFDREQISIPFPQRDVHIVDGTVEGAVATS